MISDIVRFVPYVVHKYRKELTLAVIVWIGGSFSIALLLSAIVNALGKGFPLFVFWGNAALIIGAAILFMAVIMVAASESME